MPHYSSLVDRHTGADRLRLIFVTHTSTHTLNLLTFNHLSSISIDSESLIRTLDHRKPQPAPCLDSMKPAPYSSERPTTQGSGKPLGVTHSRLDMHTNEHRIKLIIIVIILTFTPTAGHFRTTISRNFINIQLEQRTSSKTSAFIR